MGISLVTMETVGKPYINKITVITPTIRLEGLDLVQKALEKQTFTDFDWLVCSPEEPKDTWATWIPDKFKGGLWTLNRAYNALIKAAECQLIVSWQDYTSAGAKTLQRFWNHYEYEPKMLVSALGHKYKDDSWMERVWEDLRPPGPCTFQFVEWNLCSCPRQPLVDIGGFDEGADFLYFGLDGYQVNERLAQTGQMFLCDPNIESFSLVHGRVPDWDEKNGMGRNNSGEPYIKRKNALIGGKLWPVIGKLGL